MQLSDEQLKALAAYAQNGDFEYEANPNFDGTDGRPIQGHIVRFNPHNRMNADGSVRLSINFPAFVASDWLTKPAEVMQALAEQLNACPAIAAELLETRARNAELERDLARHAWRSWRDEG